MAKSPMLSELTGRHLRRYALIAVVLALFAAASSLATGDTVTTTASPSPTPTFARLGYISPVTLAWAQPTLDRYANNIEDRLARTVSASIIPVPRNRHNDVDRPAMCRQLHLSGFIEPHAHWVVTSSSVTTDAELLIRDCSGHAFYDGKNSSSAERSNDSPQSQVDALQDLVAAELTRRFDAVRLKHASAWDALLNSGLSERSSEAPSPVPTATESLEEIAHVTVRFSRLNGKGILTPISWYTADVDGDPKGTCYFVTYTITFDDGIDEHGTVYWPICYQRKTDPFANNWKNFSLPRPPRGWIPTEDELTIIAQHRVLRAFFPDRFGDIEPTPIPEL